MAQILNKNDVLFRLCHDWSMGSFKIDKISSPLSWLIFITTLFFGGKILHCTLKSLFSCHCNAHSNSNSDFRRKFSWVTENGDIDQKSDENEFDDGGRISFFMQLMNYPSMSFILKWFLVKNRHDFILIFNEKIKRFDHVITRLSEPRDRLSRSRDRSCAKSSDRVTECKCVYPYAWHVFWGGWMVLFYIPTSQMITFVGFGLAERCLYPVFIGFAILISSLLKSVKVSSSPMTLICLVLLSGAMVRTDRRCADWKSDFDLSKSGSDSGSLKSKINLASHFSKREMYPEAINLLESVVKIHQSSDIFYNM